MMHMDSTSEPVPVMLFMGLMYREKAVFEIAIQELTDRFGRVILRSPVFDFNFTDYYTHEMGAGLKKAFIAFETHVDPGSLAEIKIITNKIEARLSALSEGKQMRKINIDPGYATQRKVVLASTKNRSRRIYLGEGIYAEVTLQFKEGKWEPLPWTYTDFKTQIAQEFLTGLRESL